MKQYSPAPKAYYTVLYSKKEFSATITLNRLKVHNALNLEMLQELGDAEVAVGRRCRRHCHNRLRRKGVLHRHAREILMHGKELKAKEALAWGLINQVVPRRKLDRAVDAMVETLVNKLPDCTRNTKEQLNFWRNFSWAMTIGHAKDWLTVHASAPKIIEGIRAFNERRPIDYR